MANTKVTGDLIASSTIATGNIADNAVTSDKISGITTAHITEGSNLYYTDARADARITAATTSDLSEGTNLYYTDARADARAALLVDSAPSTLDTLNELAAALGDDPNFATTVTNSIATKLPLAGGTMTGELINTSTAGITANSTSHAYLTVNSSAATTASWVNYKQGGTGRWLAGVEGSETKWQLYSSGTKFSIDTSGNGTFAGEISSGDDINVNNGKLVVNHASAEVRIKSTSDTGESYISFSDPSDINPGQIYYGHSSNAMVFRTNDNERMRIDGSGKVSVGICTGNLKEFNVKNQGSSGGLRIEHSGSANTVAFLGQGGSGDEGVLFLQDSGVDTVKIAGENGLDSFINSGNVGIGTSSITNYGLNYQNLDVSGSNGAYITLIGTTNTVKVDIAAETAAGYVGTKTAHPFIFRTNDVERMRITSGGQVSLPTTALNDTRHIILTGTQGTTNNACAIGMWGNEARFSSNWYYNGAQQKTVAGNGMAVIGLATGTTDATSYITFGVNGPTATGGPTERMRIDSSGYISTPADKRISVGAWDNSGFTSGAAFGFSVQSTTPGLFLTETDQTSRKGFVTMSGGGMYIGGSVDFIALDANNGNRAVTINSSLNVGIGTTSPNQKLEVAGNIRIDSRSKLGSGEVDNITFTKNRPDAGTGTYEMGAIRSFTTNGYSGGMRFYSGRHTGGGGYALIAALTIGDPANIGPAVVIKNGDTTSARIYPETDNAGYLGESTHRWQAVYAVNGSIQTSDRNQKTSITKSDLGLDFILKLEPVSYKWKVGGWDIKENGEDKEPTKTPIEGKRNHYGLIAQQVKEVIGDKDFGGWVKEDLEDEASVESLRYAEFISPMIKAIQELKAEIEILKNK